MKYMYMDVKRGEERCVGIIGLFKVTQNSDTTQVWQDPRKGCSLRIHKHFVLPRSIDRSSLQERPRSAQLEPGAGWASRVAWRSTYF